MDEASVVCVQLQFITNPMSSLNIFIWAISLICQAACTNFAELFVCRLILGMCEGSITAGFMIVTSMFYTRKEQTLRVGYWCECLSSSGVVIYADKWLVLMNGIGKPIELCRGQCLLVRQPKSSLLSSALDLYTLEPPDSLPGNGEVLVAEEGCGKTNFL